MELGLGQFCHFHPCVGQGAGSIARLLSVHISESLGHRHYSFPCGSEFTPKGLGTEVMGTHSRCSNSSNSSVLHTNLTFFKCLYYVSDPEPNMYSHLKFILSCEKDIIIPVVERRKVKTREV